MASSSLVPSRSARMRSRNGSSKPRKHRLHEDYKATEKVLINSAKKRKFLSNIVKTYPKHAVLSGVAAVTVATIGGLKLFTSSSAVSSSSSSPILTSNMLRTPEARHGSSTTTSERTSTTTSSDRGEGKERQVPCIMLNSLENHDILRSGPPVLKRSHKKRRDEELETSSEEHVHKSKIYHSSQLWLERLLFNNSPDTRNKCLVSINEHLGITIKYKEHVIEFTTNIKSPLGRGVFGAAYLYTDNRDHLKFVLKTLQSNDNEIKVVRKINKDKLNCNILLSRTVEFPNVHAVILQAMTNHVGSRCWNKQEILTIGKCVMDQIFCLARCNYTYMDIKAQNMLYRADDDGLKIRVADLGSILEIEKWKHSITSYAWPKHYTMEQAQRYLIARMMAGLSLFITNEQEKHDTLMTDIDFLQRINQRIIDDYGVEFRMVPLANC